VTGVFLLSAVLRPRRRDCDCIGRVPLWDECGAFTADVSAYKIHTLQAHLEEGFESAPLKLMLRNQSFLWNNYKSTETLYFIQIKIQIPSLLHIPLIGIQLQFNPATNSDKFTPVNTDVKSSTSPATYGHQDQPDCNCADWTFKELPLSELATDTLFFGTATCRLSPPGSSFDTDDLLPWAHWLESMTFADCRFFGSLP